MSNLGDRVLIVGPSEDNIMPTVKLLYHTGETWDLKKVAYMYESSIGIKYETYYIMDKINVGMVQAICALRILENRPIHSNICLYNTKHINVSLSPFHIFFHIIIYFVLFSLFIYFILLYVVHFLY